MAAMNFFDVVKLMFADKEAYFELPDSVKETNFYIINKKLSVKYPKVAQFLNDKGLDKATALDYWALFFRNERIAPGCMSRKYSPGSVKGKSKLSDEYIDILSGYYDIDDVGTAEFLYEHFTEEVTECVEMIINLKKKGNK